MFTAERLRADARSLNALASLNAGYLKVAQITPDLRRFVIDAEVEAPVVAAEGYRILPHHRLLVEIPDNYLSRDSNGLFVKSRIRRDGDRVWHPNVWPSDGYFCYDDQFYPAKTMADQVVSALELMQCRAINHESPADWDADYYYLKSGDSIRNQLRPVNFRVPLAFISLRQRSLPRLS